MRFFAFIIAFLCLHTAYAADVDTISVPSAVMHRSFRCVVITPAEYKSSTRRFPVVYLLHGYDGNYSNWITKVPAIRELADRYQCMIVCPDGVNSWYVDSPADSSRRFETYVGKELPAYIDQHYSTIPSPQSRAITGLSMGGHGALYLAIRHPETFGAAGSISGGVDLRPFPKSWNLPKIFGDPGPNGANWTNYMVIKQIEQLKPGTLPLIIDCGVKDFFIDVNRNLHQRLLQLGIPHDYTERPGEHNWDYWSNSVQYQLLFFHRFFAR
ncbi:alpha/beta hydrolase [Chitinophaga vietnamensis]|uniref:alpha/beta hydrolase n=1 Tax=Chitinophaga vietnamensis TaxID=2593957 RepID=UPI001177A78F|nr:alpha/beta hydrolase family protein [Chitinophaga vietnamensis]